MTRTVIIEISCIQCGHEENYCKEELNERLKVDGWTINGYKEDICKNCSRNNNSIKKVIEWGYDENCGDIDNFYKIGKKTFERFIAKREEELYKELENRVAVEIWIDIEKIKPVEVITIGERKFIGGIKND